MTPRGDFFNGDIMQKPETTSKPTSIQCPALHFSWPAILTAVIIAVRAFQSNAEPMSSWSVSSWIWMTLPMWFPVISGIIILAAMLLVYVWQNSR